MNKHETHFQYHLIPNDEGKHVVFPVSKHVLQIGAPLARQSKLTRVRKWRPSLAQQGATLALMLTLCASSFGITYGHLDNTLAYFRDDETSRDNVLAAGALDFTVSPDGDIVALIEEGEKIVVPVMTPEPGTFPTMYRVTATTTLPVNPFCAALDAVASTSPFVYNGDLLALSVTATTTSGAWPLELSLPDASTTPSGTTCTLEIVYSGWHKDVPENTGYTDEERYQLTVSFEQSPIVLNEFLPNPDTSASGFNMGIDTDIMPQGEWVELYNNGDMPVDLAGWYVWDASNSSGNKKLITALNTAPATTIIPAHGFLVVYMNDAVFNNTGDDVRLYNGSDVLMDAHTYTSHDLCTLDPTPGVVNDPVGAGGSCPDVPPNKSYARIPDGIGEWIDPIPTPGAPNILDVVVEPVEETLEAAVLGESDEPVVEPEPEVASTTPPLENPAPVEPEPTPEPVVDNSSPKESVTQQEPPAEPQEPEAPADEPPTEEPIIEETNDTAPISDPPADEPSGPEPTPEPSTEPPPPVDVPPPPAEEPPPPEVPASE